MRIGNLEFKLLNGKRKKRKFKIDLWDILLVVVILGTSVLLIYSNGLDAVIDKIAFVVIGGVTAIFFTRIVKKAGW
jgi:hypothetical protein